MSLYQEPDETARASYPSLSRVGYLVKRVQAALRASMDQAFRPIGLGVSQYAILEALVELPESDATNAAIARRCFISPQSANEMIATMAEGRLVLRRSTTGTRRITFLLTKRGRDKCVEGRRLSLEIKSECFPARRKMTASA